MRLTAITFSGYQSGQADFATVFESAGETEREQILSVVERIADQIIEDDSNQFTSIIVTGHSDRQDRSDFSCDQRRASEISAARDRAVSAWEWVKARVTERLAQSGIDAGEWWESSSRVTWALVFAAAGMLEHDPPASEADRLENRRVIILVSMFTCG
jgi:flagellar motor protein MotB